MSAALSDIWWFLLVLVLCFAVAGVCGVLLAKAMKDYVDSEKDR